MVEMSVDPNSESPNAVTMESSASSGYTRDIDFQEVERMQIRLWKYRGCRHRLGKEYCKSYRKLCNLCKRFNHATKVCWFRRQKNIRVECSKRKGKAAKEATYNVQVKIN